MQERTFDAPPLGEPSYSARPDAAPRHARVQEIDFRRPTKFPREVVRRLEHAHESFCRTASSGISAELRTSFELAVGPSEQLPYGTAMAEAKQDSLLVVLEVKPLGTHVAMLVEMPLGIRLVDRLLGGSGKPRTAQSESLTDLEVVILKRAVESIVKPLSATWLDLAEVELSVGPVQTSPLTLQLVSPSEPVLIMTIEARLDGCISPISLCIPYRAVAAVVPRLENRHHGERVIDPAAAGAVKAAVSGVDLELRAEVGAVDVPLSQVLDLRVGDTIKLRRPADRGVVLFAGDVPTYVGQPGRNGNSRAVQLRGRWEAGR